MYKNGDDMNINVMKESIIEYCENIFALSINKSENNLELKKLLSELTFYEDKVRICSEINKVNNYKKIIMYTINRIEEIINE